MHIDMVLYMDDRHLAELEDVSKNAKASVRVVPTNLKWLKDNIHAWRQLPEQYAVMQSQAYKNLTHGREEAPEVTNPVSTELCSTSRYVLSHKS
jgi:hypothetical protein